VHDELEREVASFVGKEAALVFGMGFATNSLTLPVLMRGKDSLIISDSLNHASIVAGVRGSGARVKVFRHNEPEHLERVLRAAIAEGCVQPCGGMRVELRCRSAHLTQLTRPHLRVCAQAAAHAPPVGQDPHRGGGHLQHGGRDLPPAGDRGHQEKVPSVPVCG
jgi:hypothetical protein